MADELREEYPYYECPNCEGSGIEPGTSDQDPEPCDDCHGRGVRDPLG